MAKKGHKGKWQREDRLLDYIASHQAEITRYLVVVLISELWRWVMDNLLYGFVPFLLPFRTGCTFLLWALPYFFVCKLWVWKQKEDSGYVWCIQGMKFIMAIIIIGIVGNVTHYVMGLMHLGTSVQALFGHLIEELLYFIAMFKFILRPGKEK